MSFKNKHLLRIGGESGIRTHGRFNPSPVFKTGALNRSAISPIGSRSPGQRRILAREGHLPKTTLAPALRIRHGGASTAIGSPMAHLDLANLRTTLLDDTQLAAVALHRTFAGHLPVSSGHLVVCDPLVQAEAPALADYTAPLGRHPVEIIVHSGRPALAVVWFKPREALTASALHWQMARWTTQDLTGLDEDSFIGYPVDAGIGCFMDTDTQQALLALIEQANGDEDSAWSDA